MPARSRRYAHAGPLAVCLIACAPTGTDAPIAFPPANPFLADSPWPISHAGPHSQGASPNPGLPEAEAWEVQHVEVGLPSITLAFEPARDDGSRYLWGSTQLQVYRMRVDDPPVVVDSVPAGGGVGDIVAGAYTLIDRDGRFYATTPTEIRAYVATDTDGTIERVGSWALGDPADGESLRGLGITYDGVLIAASSTGRVVAVDRLDLDLLGEVALDGGVSNSIALDEDGGIYVVTSEAMHRVQWTGEALSIDPADGAWEAAYETGASDVAGGRLGAGSGSTPSLMTVGDDALVVITDAQPLMHLVAFWRGAVPEGWTPPDGTDPRTAGIVPVTFGDPEADSSLSEQSVLVMGDGAVVVNNDYGDATGIAPVLDGIAPPGIERFTWDAEADTLTSTWAIPDLSCPNGIPTASGPDRRMFCVGKRGQTWTIEAIAWDSGEPAFHVEMGEGQDFNSTYAATEIGPDGEIWTGTFTGVVRVRAE